MLSCTKVFIIEIETLFERSISERNYLIFILSDKNRVYMYQVRKSVDLDKKHKTKNHQAVHIHLLKRKKNSPRHRTISDNSYDKELHSNGRKQNY
jgi:hypothetical protein